MSLAYMMEKRARLQGLNSYAFRWAEMLLHLKGRYCETVYHDHHHNHRNHHHNNHHHHHWGSHNRDISWHLQREARVAMSCPNEISALLGCNAVQIGSYLSRFRCNLPFPYSRVKQSSNSVVSQAIKDGLSSFRCSAFLTGQCIIFTAYRRVYNIHGLQDTV